MLFVTASSSLLQALLEVAVEAAAVPGAADRQQLTLAPVGSRLPGRVRLHGVGELIDDQLQDLHQQGNVRPALRVCRGSTDSEDGLGWEGP